MSKKELVTQSELQGIEDRLGTLASNLTLHELASLSKAHALNIGSDTYFDSKGSLWAAQTVRVNVSGQVLYVPAQILAPDPGPGSEPTITDTLSASEAGGSSLVTAFSGPQEAIADGSNEALLEHSGKDGQSVHGNLTTLAETTQDSDSAIVGNAVILILVDGVFYKIIGDPRAVGPVQPPRVDLTPADCPVVIALGPSGRSQPTLCRIWDRAKDGQSGGNYTVECEILGGTHPINYQWQVSVDDTVSWTNIVADTDYTSTRTFRLEVPSTTNPPTGVLNPATNKCQAEIQLKHGSGTSNKTEDPAFYLRCVFENSGLTGGGSITTSTMNIGMKDKTDSCSLWTTGYYSGLVSADQVYDMVRFRLKYQIGGFFGDRVRAGYYILAQRFVDNVANRDKIGIFIVNHVLAPYHANIMGKMGEYKPSLKDRILGSLISFCWFSYYYIDYEKCKEALNKGEDTTLMRTYRNIFKNRTKKR